MTHVRCPHGYMREGWCFACAREPLSEREPVRHDVLVYLLIAVLFVAAAIAGSVAVS